MKNLVIFSIIFILAVLLGVVSLPWDYDRERYLSNKVLDNSIPFDVRIDEEFLKGLTPADDTI